MHWGTFVIKNCADGFVYIQLLSSPGANLQFVSSLSWAEVMLLFKWI